MKDTIISATTTGNNIASTIGRKVTIMRIATFCGSATLLQQFLFCLAWFDRGAFAAGVKRDCRSNCYIEFHYNYG